MKTEEFRKTLRLLLSNLKVCDLPPAPKDLIIISRDETLLQGFQKLLANNIMSAPVERETGSGFVGSLEVKALVCCVLRVHHQHKRDLSQVLTRTQTLPQIVSQLSSPRKSSLDNVHNDADLTLEQQVSNAVRNSPYTFLHTVAQDASMLSVCEILMTGVARVGVVDHKGKLVRIVSQSWVIDALSSLIDQMGTLPFALTLEEMGFGTKNVVRCALDNPLVDALQVMDRHHVSAVAVVDSEDHIVAQVTPETLCDFIANPNIDDLDKLVSSWVTNPSLENGAQITVTLSSTLGDVFSKFAKTKSHRLFIVDEDGLPCGVCSLKDMLACLVRVNQ